MDGQLKEVKLNTKGLQNLNAGTPGSNNIVLNGCKLMHATFANINTANIRCIEFCNHYSSHVKICGKFKIADATSSGESFRLEWRTLVNKKLMPEPHYATGAECKFVLKSCDFLNQAIDVCALKIVIQQPSVQFSDFSINNLKVYQHGDSEVSSDQLSEWLLAKQDEKFTTKHAGTIKDFPPLDSVSLLLQKMWALGKKTSDMSQMVEQQKRFDKDGCYDINLLSY